MLLKEIARANDQATADIKQASGTRIPDTATQHGAPQHGEPRAEGLAAEP